MPFDPLLLNRRSNSFFSCFLFGVLNEPTWPIAHSPHLAEKELGHPLEPLGAKELGHPLKTHRTLSPL